MIFLRYRYRVFFLKLVLCAPVVFLSPKVSQGQIQVTDNITALALAQQLTGQGVTIMNPVLNCPAHANGTFKVVSSTVSIDSGIVLTTGRAATSGGSYGVNGASSFLASTNNGTPGDAQLEALAGVTTYDACGLEFDIVPQGDTASFNYVFSSEEYKNAVCGPYNDAFAFFISGPGISGSDNMALIPGTNIPVTINTVNSGTPGAMWNISGCSSMGAGSPFTADYIDNSTGTTLTHFGLTTKLRAFHHVMPCATYHLKIVIADGGNETYDSGVFLEAGSLHTSAYHIIAVNTLDSGHTPFAVKGCLPAKFLITRQGSTAESQTLKYITTGTAISSVDYTALPDSITIPAGDTGVMLTVNCLPTPLAGTKILHLNLLASFACTGTSIVDSAEVVIYDTAHIVIAPSMINKCGNDTVQAIAAGDSIYTYSWAPTTGIDNSDTQQPGIFIATPTIYTVTAALAGTSCMASATLGINIKPTPTVYLVADTTVCLNSTLILQPDVLPASRGYSYAWSGPSGIEDASANIALNNITQGNVGIYTLVVTDTLSKCATMATTDVQVAVISTPIVISPIAICHGAQPVELSAQGAALQWYNADTGTASNTAPLIQTSEIGTSNYFVSQSANGCESPKAEISVLVQKCCDGIFFIPSAFTPNGDGVNDKFHVSKDAGYVIESIGIYNRWGQLVFSGNSDSWDGTFNNKAADAGTYFYEIIIGCVTGGIINRKGEVTLIR